MDGTPRSAKAAGKELRKLTDTFYERLKDPRFYGVTDEELGDRVVKTKFWDQDISTGSSGLWQYGTRPLMRYGGRIGTSKSHRYYVPSDWSDGDAIQRIPYY